MSILILVYYKFKHYYSCKQSILSVINSKNMNFFIYIFIEASNPGPMERSKKESDKPFSNVESLA